jgi:hypothetical protein
VAIRKLSFGVGGGGLAPALTARKLGMTPGMRFGCGLNGCSSELAADVEGDGESGGACAGLLAEF